MALEAITAMLGLSLLKKKESRIEPFVRTLAAADIAQNEARIRLVEATKELAGLSLKDALNKRGSDNA